MKKLLYLLLAVALVGCAKDDLEVSSGSNETLSFIISDDLSTRADTDKTAWEVDDLLAIFVGDTETSKQYKVASVGSDGKAILAPATSDDGILNNGTYADVTFTAYYPYEADRTLSDYQAQEDDADVLYSTGEVSNGTVTFATFTHENTHVTFNFVAGREYSTDGFKYIDIELRSGSTPLWKHTISEFGDDATTASYSLYCPALDDLSGVVLYMVANGALDAYYAVDLGADTTIEEWEAGTPYIYNDLLIGSCDILYDGDGAYQVYSATGLQALANLVNGTNDNAGAATIGDIEFSTDLQSDINIVLMNDIDLSEVCGEGNSWTPIGSGEVISGDDTDDPDDDVIICYSGTFDGGGYEISGLYINSDAINQGLFGCTVGATIQNLGVSGSITGTGPEDEMAVCIGGIAGYADDGSTITNCYNKVTLTGTLSALYKSLTLYAGGIVGKIENSKVIKCYNMGEITGSITVGDSSVSLGGVVGLAMSNGGNLEITECYNLGNVTGTSTALAYVGGVVGYFSFCSSLGCSSTLTACYNSGNITATATYNAYVGGVAGDVDYYNLGSNASDNSSITSCYSYGSVSLSSSGYLGGVIGWNRGYDLSSESDSSGVKYTTISYCYYDKTVESSISAVGSGITSISNVEGLATTDMQGTTLLTNLLKGTEASTYWQADNGTNNGYPILIWQATN